MPEGLAGKKRRIRRRFAQVARTPFFRLVIHFLRRAGRAGGSQAAGEIEIGAGPLLGLLAAPGAFQALLLLDKYSSLLNWMRSRLDEDLLTISIPDKLLFIAVSMAITSIVAVLKWDRLLPDAQDYVNLAPLPVRPWQILWANVIAIAIIAAVVTATVNAASSLLFPLFVASAAPGGSISFGQFAIVHIGVVSTASLFGFFLILAVMGALSAILPKGLFEPASTLFRAVLLIASLIVIPMAAQLGPALLDSAVRGRSVALLYPPGWFLGLYQVLQDRGPEAVATLAPRATLGLLVAFGAACLSYGFSYRRRFRAISDAQGGAVGDRVARFVLGLLERATMRRSPFDKAVAAFTIRGLVFDSTHRLVLLVPLGLAWFIAAQMPFSFGAALLVPAYLLVLGLRVAVDLPLSLPANWIFQSLLLQSNRSCRAAVRGVASAAILVLVIVPGAVMYSSRSLGFKAAFTGLAGVFLLSLIHIELIFARYHNLPFTRAFPPFRHNLPVKCFLHAIGFALYLGLGARLIRWSPAGVLLAGAIAFALRRWNESAHHAEQATGTPDARIAFDHQDTGELTVMGLSPSASLVNSSKPSAQA